jgi:phosphoserine phosphatase
MHDLQRENEKLRRVLDVARHLAATVDLDALLGTIVEAACGVLDCERATIFLHDKQTDELYSRVATGEPQIRFPANRGIAGTAAVQRAIVNVPDAYADDRFNIEIDKKTGFRTRNLLTFALEDLHGDLVGVLQALNKRGGPFDDEDERMAGVLSAQAGVAVQRWFLLEEYAEKQRLARDLDIARDIQQAIFPDENPIVEGYEIAGWSNPADETGGDCYDFFALPDGRLAVLLADATGHGIGAALIIAQCRSLLRAMLSVTDDLAVIAERVNDLLAEDLADSRFVTAFFGILDPVRHEMRYVAGGQGPLLFMKPGGEVESRRASGLPFAVLRGTTYDPPPPFELSPGSMLILLTDGIYETASPERELFGESRVIGLVRENASSPLEEIVSRLHAASVLFSAGAVQADDVTAVLIRRR